ncbi:hypothetical protein MHO82_22895 [Vibrio sp. Of7-15]|uniref:hypothetical protein n=1 Tax=Vibrio sp. Of7-15 TaxID=2724879 RepID=UPI001EF26CD0|nr:hypothetical protein [Vibrio sp. Of7-15]MCG7499717.1 hypothetical protein [Vibrio sp. Of7-15]
MTKISVFVISTLLTSASVMADTVHVLVENITGSTHEVVSTLENMQGILDTKTALPELYANRNFNVAVIDSNKLKNDHVVLSKDQLSDIDSIIILGSPEHNQEVAQQLVGYGTSKDYLVIRGVKNPTNIEMTYFDKNESGTSKNVAKSLLKAAM